MLRKIGKAAGGFIGLAGVIVGALAIPQIHDLVWPPETSEVQRVVTTLKLSLADSARVRTSLGYILSDVNFCRYWPHDEAPKVRNVASRRDRSAQRLAKVAQTDDSDAKGLLDGYALVLDTSRAADDAYADWLMSWDARFKDFQSKMHPKKKCPIDRRGALYHDFLEADEAAGEAKRSFLNLYRKPAMKYHAHIWKATEI